MSRSLPLGTTINGYRIERTLSENGNFAMVYLAYDTDDGRVARRRERIIGRLQRWRDRYGAAAASVTLNPGPLVALKEYIPNFYGVRRNLAVDAVSGEGEAFAWGRERFERERRFLSEHSHPNVVAVFDVFSANNTEYYVMEQLSGGSLRNLVDRRGRQTEAQVRGWLIPTLEGLMSVETRDANHLDLSPDNIMFRQPGGEPVIVDFGASRIGGVTPNHATRLVINDSYAAPEKYTLSSSKLSAQTDIYSLGGIIVYALTGDTPTAANERLAGAPAYSDKTRDQLVARTKHSFLSLIDRAFSIDRGLRFQDSRDFYDALGASDVRSQGKDVGFIDPPTALTDRDIIIIGLATAALIVLATALVLVIGKF